MNLSRPVLFFTLAISSLATICAEAQTSNPPYVSQFPTFEQLRSEIKGRDAMDTAGRLIGAAWQLRKVIETFAGRRMHLNQLTVAEGTLIGQYNYGYQEVYKPYASYPDRPAWYRVHSFYETDPGFLDELLRRYLTAELRNNYYLTTGRRPPRTPADPPAISVPANTNQQTAKNPKPMSEADLESLKQRAEALFSEAVASIPDANTAAYYGYQNYEKKNYKMAREYFQRALSLDPKHELALRGSAQLYQVLKEWPLVIAMRKRLAAIKPNDADNLSWLGTAQREAKLYDDALVSLNSAVRLKPDPSDYYWIGFLYNEKKQFERAVPTFQESLRLDPTHASSSYNLGVALFNLKQYPNAIDAFQKSLALKIDNPQYVYGWIGDSYTARKQFGQAVTAYKESLRLDPNYANASFNLGVAFFNLKEYANAAQAFRISVELKIGNPHFAYGWIGDAYYEDRLFDLAIVPYKEAIRLKPDYDYVLNKLGVCHYALKQFPEALIAYRSATRIKPGETIYQRNIGDTYVMLGKKAEAMAVYQKLLPIDATQAKALLDHINKVP